MHRDVTRTITKRLYMLYAIMFMTLITSTCHGMNPVNDIRELQYMIAADTNVWDQNRNIWYKIIKWPNGSKQVISEEDLVKLNAKIELHERINDPEGVKNINDLYLILNGWPYRSFSMLERAGNLRVLQEQLHCYPDYARADFLGKDDEWKALRDQMDMLHAGMDSNELKVLIDTFDIEKLDAGNPKSVDKEKVKHIQEYYSQVCKVRELLDSHMKLWNKAEAAMHRLIAAKEKKCVVM